MSKGRRKPTKMAALAGAAVLTTLHTVAAQQPAVHAPALRALPTQRSAQASASIAAPQSTTATYADWVVQCQTRAGPPREKACDMAQVTRQRNVLFSRIAVMQPVKGRPVRLVIQVPVNVSLATSVRIQMSSADPGIAAPFARCVPGGCFAEFELKDDSVRQYRAASGTGSLSFADSSGRTISVPLSFKGFAQAFDALARE